MLDHVAAKISRECSIFSSQEYSAKLDPSGSGAWVDNFHSLRRANFSYATRSNLSTVYWRGAA
jgi:hypothetical protein